MKELSQKKLIDMVSGGALIDQTHCFPPMPRIPSEPHNPIPGPLKPVPGLVITFGEHENGGKHIGE